MIGPRFLVGVAVGALAAHVVGAHLLGRTAGRKAIGPLLPKIPRGLRRQPRMGPF